MGSETGERKMKKVEKTLLTKGFSSDSIASTPHLAGASRPLRQLAQKKNEKF